MLLYFNLKKK